MFCSLGLSCELELLEASICSRKRASVFPRDSFTSQHLMPHQSLSYLVESNYKVTSHLFQVIPLLMQGSSSYQCSVCSAEVHGHFTLQCWRLSPPSPRSCCSLSHLPPEYQQTWSELAPEPESLISNSIVFVSTLLPTSCMYLSLHYLLGQIQL